MWGKGTGNYYLLFVVSIASRMAIRGVSDAAHLVPAPLPPPTPLTVSPAVHDTLKHLPPLFVKHLPVARSTAGDSFGDSSHGPLLI